MTIHKLIKLTCPYCHHEWVENFPIESLSGELHMVFCDNEEDRGCGRTFAIKNVIEIKTTVYKLQEQTQ